MKDRIVVCAGCSERFPSQETITYRRKRCCQKPECYKVIDKKVTNANYKKQRKKIENGKFRHGVPIDLKQIIHKRDNDTCRNCLKVIDKFDMQIHHILPVSEGGVDDLVNLVLLCKTCHTEVHKEGHEKYHGKFRTYTESLESIC